MSTFELCLRRAMLLSAIAGLLAACAHAPDVPKIDRSPGLDLAPIAARYGVPLCKVSVPISQAEALAHVERWDGFRLEKISAWNAMVEATQPGDQLRQVICVPKGRPGGNVFFGLFRDGAMVAETHYVILD
jgi:hypothetical protein